MWNMLKHFGLKLLHKDDSSPRVSLNYVVGQRFNWRMNMQLCLVPGPEINHADVPRLLRALRPPPALHIRIPCFLPPCSGCTVSSFTSCQMYNVAAAAASSTANVTARAEPQMFLDFGALTSALSLPLRSSCLHPVNIVLNPCLYPWLDFM